MPIKGWILAGTLCLPVIIMAGALFADLDGLANKILTVLIALLLIGAVLGGLFWYYNNTAAGQRAMVDQKSNFGNGLERTVTIYTANGDVIATYTGLIDIDTNDGGYVKFDFEGKRYIYYNCFVESIAVID